MGKAKRPSTDGSGGRAVKNKSGASFEGKPEISQGFVLYPFLRTAVEKFDAWWKEHEDLESIMRKLWPDAEAQQMWARKLDHLFPADPNITYLKPDWEDDEHGVKYLRPYHWAWLKVAGNKGPVNNEAYRNLLASILTKGFVTDVTSAGIELPLITPPREGLEDELKFCGQPTVSEAWILLKPLSHVHCVGVTLLPHIPYLATHYCPDGPLNCKA